MTSRSQSPGAALSRKRWEKTTPEQRSQIARDLNEARWKKVSMCACGCGLTLERATKRHPRRAKMLQL